MALAAFTERLKSFRPAATVFEAEIARVKSTFANPLLLEGGSASLGRGGKSTEVMATKRAAHAHIIEKERQKKVGTAMVVNLNLSRDLKDVCDLCSSARLQPEGIVWLALISRTASLLFGGSVLTV